MPATLRYLAAIRKAVLIEGQDAYLDMERCEHISPGGCIMLAAEVDRCITVRPSSIDGDDPLSEKAKMTLARFGFHEHLDFRRPRLSKKPGRALRIRSSEGPPHGEGPTLALVSTMAYDLFGNTEFQKRVYGALDEAVSNVTAHAFDKDFAAQLPFEDGRWWLAGVANSKKSGASFYVLDHGPGVPTVARSKMRNEIDAYWQNDPARCKSPAAELPDRDVLLATAEARRSGGMHGPDGRGFDAMIRLIADWADVGSVRIISGRAAYSFKPLKPNSLSGLRQYSPGKCFGLANEFPGTLIVWSVTKPRTATEMV